MKKILVTGAFGQIGSELVPVLREKYGKENVIAMGHITSPTPRLEEGPIVFGDVVHKEDLDKMIRKFDIDTVYHLAAIISAKGELNPQIAYKINMTGLYNVLELAREHALERIVVPSSMAVFGPDAPQDNTPTDTILHPTTMYGMTKVAGELLGSYYFSKYGIDVRGVRYPGILSSETPPTAGTTDYATAVFYDGIRTRKYECFLKEDTTLPMMYMCDAIKALMDLAEAPLKNLKHHTDFNVAAMSFSPKEIFTELKKYLPDLQISYKPDYRQAIADSWPRSLDDSAAHEEWGWKHSIDLPTMVKDLYEKLSARLEK
ncbi:NAD-dependent epimerase/dehydratase family protein [Candidatus Micrarchaeota archaeon]|nr:NAD-dependent epimerase/dehydratase family protein [Candidatus Micrarchaeota archaeon]MBU1930414.1 NAD-dependent epimerase/dehydratase family protein [Candidatus Micrarchaeota archaeon]